MWKKTIRKNPFTTVKPPLYRNNYLNTLIHSLVHTYHPDITERNKVDYTDVEQTNNFFEMNHIDLYKFIMTNITVYSVQNTQKLDPRVILPLPYFKGMLQFPKNFLSQHSDPNINI